MLMKYLSVMGSLFRRRQSCSTTIRMPMDGDKLVQRPRGKLPRRTLRAKFRCNVNFDEEQPSVIQDGSRDN